MRMNMRFLFVYYLILIIIGTSINSCHKIDGLYELFNRIINKCDNNEDTIKCLKIYGIKIVDHVSKSQRIDLSNGLSIIKSVTTSSGRQLHTTHNFHFLQSLTSTALDDMLWTKVNEFINGHQIQMKLLPLIEEARRKKGRRYIWPLIIALGVKTVLMLMSYQSVAVMSGAALILGKLALLLSAILGLKKLVSSAHDKSTTLEIVKQPQHSHSHTYSHSYEDDGHYHRNYDVDDDDDPQRMAYNAYT